MVLIDRERWELHRPEKMLVLGILKRKKNLINSGENVITQKYLAVKRLIKSVS